MAQRKQHSKDQRPQGKSARTARGLASPGGSGTPPEAPHQAAGQGEGERATGTRVASTAPRPKPEREPRK